jgi:hypothetical protein
LQAMMRARWLSALRDRIKRVQRHDEQSAEHADQRAVERTSSRRRRGSCSR